jgi:hypothetical protein
LAASAFALAFAASQSAFVIDTQPVPLQLFIPLQLFFADLHSEVPLQEFTPEQCIVAPSAAADTPANPEVNNIAAAAANAALDTLFICMIASSIVIQRSEIAARLQDLANAGIITELSELRSLFNFGSSCIRRPAALEWFFHADGRAPRRYAPTETWYWRGGFGDTRAARITLGTFPFRASLPTDAFGRRVRRARP